MKPARFCLTGVVGAALVLSGCSGHHSGGSKEASGVVAGQYTLAGGPAPGLARPQTGTIWAYSGDLDLARVQGAAAVAHVRTDASGKFSLSLKPGEYTLLGALGVASSEHSNGCGVPTVVHIKAAIHVKADLVCSVP